MSRAGKSLGSLTTLIIVLVLCAIALFYSPLAAPTAHAQSSSPTPVSVPTSTQMAVPVSADQVNAIARNLYCPVCENTPLEVCPTDACARWRDQVRELLAQGESEDQVRQYFIDHFGMRTVGTPTDTTSVILTIGLPFGMLIIAGVLIIWQLWRWYQKRSKPAGDFNMAIGHSPDENSSDDYQNRIEAELRKNG